MSFTPISFEDDELRAKDPLQATAPTQEPLVQSDSFTPINMETLEPEVKPVVPVEALNQMAPRVITGEISTDERNFFKRQMDNIKYGAESKVNNFSDSVDGFRQRMDDAEFSTFVNTALPIAAGVLAPNPVSYQAAAAGAAGLLTKMYENWENSKDFSVKDISGQGGRDAVISAGIDVALPPTLRVGKKAIKAGSDIVGSLLGRIAKPVLESTAARKAVEILSKKQKHLMEGFSENIAKTSDFLLNKTVKKIEDIETIINLGEQDIKNNKKRILKSMSTPYKVMKRHLGRQYDQIFKDVGDEIVDVGSEINTVVGLLGTEVKGVASSKTKLNKIFKGFDIELIKEATETSGKKKAKKKVKEIIDEVTFQDAHKLKQHLSLLRTRLKDSPSKSLIGPVSDVVDSLENKLELLSGDVYKKTNSMFRQLMINEDYVRPSLGKISKAQGIKGIRENARSVFDSILRNGKTSGEELFEVTDKKINSLATEIIMLKESGNPKMAKYGELIENRIKKVSTTAYQNGIMENVVKDMKKYNPINDDLLKFKNQFNVNNQRLIAKELEKNKALIGSSGLDFKMLALYTFGSGINYFLPAPLQKPVQAALSLAAIAKYSPTALSVLLEQTDSLVRGAAKIPMPPHKQKALSLVLKRIVDMTGEGDINE